MAGAGDYGAFIPIERIYAESLLNGYDWLPEELRPLPALDDPDDDNESLELSADGSKIEATFAMKDFSQSNEGMTYEAVLYRNGAQVTDTGGAVYKQLVSREKTDPPESAPGNVARFDVSRIPSAQQNGEFTVRVRLCPYAIGSAANTNRCSDYGPIGKSLKLPPAPQNFRQTPAGADRVELSWDTVAGVTGYEFDYRVQGAAAWGSVSGSVSNSPAIIGRLSCETTYEFIIRAYGDGSTYDSTWGFWSDVVEARTGACPAGGASGQSDAQQGNRAPDAPDLALRWSAAPGADHYLVEIPAIDYFVEVPGDRTDLEISASLVAGLEGRQTARVWNCHASGLCGVHLETWLPALPKAPQNLIATATHESITLSWDASDDSTVTGYQILRRRPDDGENNLLVHVSDTGNIDTTYTDTDVQPNTRYVYRVKAINADGVSPSSNSLTVSTEPSP